MGKVVLYVSHTLNVCLRFLCYKYNSKYYKTSTFDIIFTVYANYIGPSVMTDANCEGFPICDDRITENDRCVIKIIGIHCIHLLQVGSRLFELSRKRVNEEKQP